MTADLAGEVRAICLALPEVTERPSHGAPTWFVRASRQAIEHQPQVALPQFAGPGRVR